MRRSLLVTFVVLLVGAVPAAPAASRPEPKLPNLFAYPPSFLVGPVTGEYPDYTPGAGRFLVDGCLPEERAEGAQRCLRFMTKLTNFDLRAFRVVLRAEPSGTNAYQVVGDDYRPAGTFSVDPVSGDVVLDDFWRMRLWRFDGDDKLGRPVATTEPRPLCPMAWGLPGSRQRCDVWVQDGPLAPEPVIVLPWLWHVWYPGDFARQYIDITGVPDGRYVLEIQIDPFDNYAESYERDNRTCTVVELRGTEVRDLDDDYCWPRRT